MSLETGLEALKEEKYEEAVQLLESFCLSCPPSQVKAYIQAEMGLVKAYHHTGKYQKAIAICHKLANNKNVKVSQWAKQSLSMLYTPDGLEKLKEKGREALKQKRYEDAIKAFRAYCRSSIETTSPEYQQVQMWLVNAYKGNRQFEQASVVCDKLAESSDLMTQDWAKQEILAIKAAMSKRNATTPEI